MSRRLSAYRIAANRLRTTRITTVRTESPLVKTFTFRDKECARARPGQFLMLWIPGVDEIPFSILEARDDGTVSVAVKKVGAATQALHERKASEIVGVRGPFGNFFTQNRGRVLMVAGGTGTAPLLFLAKLIADQVARMVFVIGAKTGDELLFKDELERVLCRKNTELVATTEDGSCGTKGLCTTPVEHLLSEKFDMIYSCGPEQMIRKAFEMAEKHEVRFEASLERLMRCAIGLCGSCVIGRYQVCRDGPIFTSEQLREVRSELGISRHDFDGRRIPI